LVERLVYTEDVGSSSLSSPTIPPSLFCCVADHFWSAITSARAGAVNCRSAFSAIDDVPYLFQFSAMPRPIRTLEDAARHGLYIQAECLPCDRKALFFSLDLTQFVHPSRAIQNVPFRCKQCGSRRLKTYVVERDNERIREAVVWRPMRMKW
jgi:hypothetical protein